MLRNESQFIRWRRRKGCSQQKEETMQSLSTISFLLECCKQFPVVRRHGGRAGSAEMKQVRDQLSGHYMVYKGVWILIVGTRAPWRGFKQSHDLIIFVF